MTTQQSTMGRMVAVTSAMPAMVMRDRGIGCASCGQELLLWRQRLRGNVAKGRPPGKARSLRVYDNRMRSMLDTEHHPDCTPGPASYGGWISCRLSAKERRA
jgi:hypothetical protein